jgi:hypothetical protein
MFETLDFGFANFQDDGLHFLTPVILMALGRSANRSELSFIPLGRGATGTLKEGPTP